MKIAALHRFLHALSGEDKKEIDKHFSNSGYNEKDNLYRSLYQFLSTTEEFDLGTYNIFAAEVGLKQGTMRNYCKRIYQDSSRLLLTSSSDEDERYAIQQHLSMARRLVKMELYELAKTELAIARKKEGQLHYPGARVDIDMLNGHILFLENHKKIDRALSTLHKEAQDAQEELNREIEIYLGYQKLYQHSMRQKDKEIEQRWDQLEQRFSKIELPEGANLDTRIYYHSVQMRIAHRRNRRQEVLNWAEQLYQIFQDNPLYKTEQQHAYLTAMDHYMAAFYIQKQYQKLDPLIKELQFIQPQSPLLKTKKVGTYLYYLLAVLCNDPQQRSKTNQAQIETLRETYEQHRELINPSRSVVIRFMFSLFFLLRLDYANAELYLHDIPVQKTNKNRSDLQRIVLVVELAILADDDYLDYGFVNSKITNANQRLQSWGGLYEYEELALKHFEALITTLGKRERIDAEQDFRTALRKHKAEKNGSLHPGAEVLIEWLKSKELS